MMEWGRRGVIPQLFQCEREALTPPPPSPSHHSPVLYLSPALRDYDAADVGADEPSSTTTTVASAIAGGIAALAAADEGKSPADSPPPSLAAGLARAVCLAARHCPRVPADDGSATGAAALVLDVGDGAVSASASSAATSAAPLQPSAASSKAPRPRILVLAATPGASDAYVPMMNAVFAAQRLGTPIDACVVGPVDAGVLQQAAHLTGGLYLRPSTRAGLAQALLTAFLPHPRMRAFLSAPPADGVDLRASCFCHWRPVDVGHVCSVCLSIFCEPRPACDTCGVLFAGGAGGAGAAAGEKRAASGTPDGGAGPAERRAKGAGV